MELSTSIKKDFAALEFDENWSFAKKADGAKKYEPYSHHYHRYPAKFIGPLARKLIENESREGDLVCDTFGGCGTTLLESKLLGRRGMGFDISPVAKLISKVKNTAIVPEKLNKASARLNKRIASGAPVQNDYNVTHQRIQYWFSEENYSTLSHIYQSILEESDSDIQRFFLCAFSHCLKNSSRWLMKSIKPTIDKQKSPVGVIGVFTRHLKKMIRKNDLLYQHLKHHKRLKFDSKIYLQDIIKLKAKTQLERYNKVDLIVTSPPYVTSYEYADLHELTFLWFGQKKYKGWEKYLQDFRSFKSRFIGSSLRIKNNQICNSSIGEEIVCQLRQKDAGIANKVDTYFSRMNRSFEVMYHMLKEGKKACIVVGNTRLKQVPVLNAQVACEQLLSIGFKKDQVIKRNANTNKMIAPYRDKVTGKFTSLNSRNKTIAYHEEYILVLTK